MPCCFLFFFTSQLSFFLLVYPLSLPHVSCRQRCVNEEYMLGRRPPIRSERKTGDERKKNTHNQRRRMSGEVTQQTADRAFFFFGFSVLLFFFFLFPSSFHLYTPCEGAIVFCARLTPSLSPLLCRVCVCVPSSLSLRFFFSLFSVHHV
jgi:hypothetical protein